MEDQTRAEAKSPPTVLPQGAIYSKIAAREKEILDRLFELLQSRNENTVLGASRTLLNKIIPDLRSVELGGVVNPNGEREPIRLLINTGTGFIPATITIPSTSNGGTFTSTAQIQSVSMAPEGPQDVHSDNGSSQTGTS